MELAALTVFLLIPSLTTADLYLHIPRGSNNRLNEKSAARTNAQRLFDSQNNNRGGYNVGDKTDASASEENDQYHMTYFQSGPWQKYNNGSGKTFLNIEWTNQHGCGADKGSDKQKQNCVLVLQYMCQDDIPRSSGLSDTLGNGVKTKSQGYTAPPSLTQSKDQYLRRRAGDFDNDLGLHEPWEWYDKCYLRERNKGLFTADQKLKKNSWKYSGAIYTRQNPNGKKYGYECPEERDYFPYWHPTPWRDIVVMSENSSMCSHYQTKSFNVQPYSECVEFYSDKTTRKHYSKWNNKVDCEKAEGQWTTFHSYLEKATSYTEEKDCLKNKGDGLKYIWELPYDAEDLQKKECLIQLDKPHCVESPWSRSNHLGNGRDGLPLDYKWLLPYFPSGAEKRCVFRMRYNVSTDDYDPYNTDSRHNQNATSQVISPVQQDPYVTIGTRGALQLAINTDQTGRIFQDRSHVFKLLSRPQHLKHENIHNLNVRGKRGNIVQVYPAVEYDFAPNNLTVKEGELIHIQWTGSNSHQNGKPAGDGQSGSDGQGKAGTDRNNLVQINDLNTNFPTPYKNTSMWKGVEVKWFHNSDLTLSEQDLAISMSTAGYYSCLEGNCEDSVKNGRSVVNQLLDNAPASYGGAVLKFKLGTYHYMCTRNNNFTNRSQKGTICIKKK
ncbi:hypothetical protein ScPMuIL_008820 [Solemya velum]